MLFGGVGTSVLEVEIYQAARTTLNFTKASKLALIETGIASVTIFFYAIIEKKSKENFEKIFKYSYDEYFFSNKNLIEEKGRLDLPGRPLVYGTTPDFLRCFSISSLDELPDLPQKENEIEVETENVIEESVITE